MNHTYMHHTCRIKHQGSWIHTPYLRASCTHPSGSRIIDICILHPWVRVKYRRYMHHTYMDQVKGWRIIDTCNIHTCIIYTGIMIKDHKHMHHTYMHHGYIHHEYMHLGYKHHGCAVWIQASWMHASEKHALWMQASWIQA